MVNEYGAILQHCSAVVKPRFTTASPCFSCQVTVASGALASPLTSKPLCTLAPLGGSTTQTCASTSAGLPGGTGREVGSPSKVSGLLPSSRNWTGGLPRAVAASAV